MRAAVLSQPNHLSIEEVAPLPPGPRDVVVRVLASGVCHSDLTVVRKGVVTSPAVIMGHEGAGVVEEIGSEVTSVRVGDTVIGAFVPACGTCWFCLRDETYSCVGVGQGTTVRATSSTGPTLAFCGLGTFAEAMTCHEASVVKVDTDLPAAQLALIGCGVTTGVGAALNAAQVQAGSSVAVIGCGGVGQAVVQGAVVAGAATIIAVDPVASKREVAASLGATHGVDPAAGDPVEQVKALTGGRGADYVFEVVGAASTALQAFTSTRKGGTAVIVGMPSRMETIDIPIRDAFFAPRTIKWTMYGSARVRRDFDRIIRLIERGRLDVDHMITRTISLDDVNDALRAMEQGEVVRSVIVAG